MPRKAKDEPKNGFGEYKPFYVDFSIAERDKIITYLQGKDISWSDLCIELLDQKFKVSISWSDYQNTHYCTLTPHKANKGIYSNYIIRHNDFDRLVGIVRYFVDNHVDDGNINYQGADDYAW